MPRSLVRFSISEIIIHGIKFSEIFGYLLNGLPQTHKEALCGGSYDALAASNFVRLNIFEIVRYNNDHALKLWYVLNQIIETSWKAHFFPRE